MNSKEKERTRIKSKLRGESHYDRIGKMDQKIRKSTSYKNE